jgi:hypothetical protein
VRVGLAHAQQHLAAKPSSFAAPPACSAPRREKSPRP